MDNKDTPLNAEISEGRLLISIGIDALARFALEVPSFEESEITPKVVDSGRLAKDVLTVLQDESEDGSNRIHRLLDEAIWYAFEDGSEAFEHTEEQ